MVTSDCRNSKATCQQQPEPGAEGAQKSQACRKRLPLSKVQMQAPQGKQSEHAHNPQYKGSQQNAEDAYLWVRNASQDELLASLLFCQHLLVAVVNLA